MLYIIDGSGADIDDGGNAVGARELAGGFCYQLHLRTRAVYMRVPSTINANTSGIAKDMLALIEGDLDSGMSGPIYLAGYSLGGAAALHTARLLKDKPVEAMFLFDAVDRTVDFAGTRAIPGNVRKCYHARRDLTLPTRYADDVQLLYFAECGIPGAVGRKFTSSDKLSRYTHDLIELDASWRPRMRASAALAGLHGGFMNCGIKGPRSRYEEAFFLCSHGAMGGSALFPRSGGVPDAILHADRVGMRRVNTWMSANLISEGVLGAAMPQMTPSRPIVARCNVHDSKGIRKHTRKEIRP
jgi:pimeloyl-ACP methyl ester carboxylesterase